MNRTHFKMAALMAAALLLSSPGAFAGNYHGGHGGGGKDDLKWKFFHKAKFLLNHAEEIGLSEQQVKSIEDLKYNVKKEMIQRHAAIEVLEVDIYRLLKQRAINIDEVNNLVNQKYELKKEKTRYLVSAMAQLKQTLDDAQYEKMKELKEGRYHAKAGGEGREKKKD